MNLMAARPDRRAQLLDATIAVIGRGGLSAVTHRAVEAEAGLPHGSTTYYFRSRQQLIDAAVEHLMVVDHEAVDWIAHEIAMVLAEGRGELDHERLAAGVTGWIRARPELQLARYELTLAGARRPEIRERMRAGRETFVRLLIPIVVAAGSPEPERDASALLAMLDGLILNELTGRPDGHEPTITGLALRRILEAIRLVPAGG
jgi:AcrR family transcriptional regulator